MNRYFKMNRFRNMRVQSISSRMIKMFRWSSSTLRQILIASLSPEPSAEHKVDNQAGRRYKAEVKAGPKVEAKAEERGREQQVKKVKGRICNKFHPQTNLAMSHWTDF